MFRGQSTTRLVFEKGKLKQVDGQERSSGPTAFFPNHTFLHVLFGHRSVGELRETTRLNCRQGDMELLLGILFPKQTSHVWALG